MDNSGLNTTLLIIILVALVAGGVWFFTTQTPTEEPDASIELTLPGGESDGSSQSNE